MPDMPDKQDSIIRRIEALMRKAESTEFDAEREALLSKADELILNYQIEHAQLFADGPHGRGVDEKPIIKEVWTDNPWEPFKGYLLAFVSRHYNCKTIQYQRSRGARLRKIVGFADDIELVMVIWNSLIVQGLTMASRDMITQKPSWEHGKTWKVNYLESFAVGIDARLTEMRKMNEQKVEMTDFLPVLRKKDKEVDSAFNEAFPRTSKSSAVAHRSSGSGWNAGNAASKRADIGQKRMGSTPRLGQ